MTGKVLLLGNGINRSFRKSSWKEMIASVSDRPYKEIKALPYSMQVVAATGDMVEASAETICRGMLKDGIEEEQRAMLSELAAIPMDALLTTNYSYELEQAISGKSGGIRRNPWAKCSVPVKDEESRWLNRYSLVADTEGKEHQIWHIHGEATAPKNMVMGHYYYGKLIGWICDYMPNFLRRYHRASYRPLSWVDYFMTDDVYMFGLGMDPSEANLWYLIAAKKRRFPDTHVYFYTPDDRREDILLMLSTYGVKIIETPLDGEKGKYKRYYAKMIPEIRKAMAGSRIQICAH